MAVDEYRRHLARAHWNWREDDDRKTRKDRANGRAEKRSAKQSAARELTASAFEHGDAADEAFDAYEFCERPCCADSRYQLFLRGVI